MTRSEVDYPSELEYEKVAYVTANGSRRLDSASRHPTQDELHGLGYIGRHNSKLIITNTEAVRQLWRWKLLAASVKIMLGLSGACREAKHKS